MEAVGTAWASFCDCELRQAGEALDKALATCGHHCCDQVIEDLVLMVEEWVEASQLMARHIGERFTWQNRLTGRLAEFDSTDSGFGVDPVGRRRLRVEDTGASPG